MNSTKIEFVYHMIDQDRLQFFTIKDAYNNVLLDQRDPMHTPETVKDIIENFMTMNQGVYIIEFRTTPKPQGQNSKKYKYTVNNMGMGEGIMGHTPSLNNRGVIPGSEFFALYRESQANLNKAQSEKFEEMMKTMASNSENAMKIFQLQHKIDNTNKSDHMSKLATTMIGHFLGGTGVAPPAGISGLGDGNADINIDSADEQKINNAVTGLMRIDSNFAEHIDLLYKMASNNRPMYNMAIESLKKIG